MKYLTLESYDTHQPTNCIKLSHSDAKCFDVDKKDRVIIGGKNEILIINLNENNSEQLLKSKSIKRWGISHVKWSTTNKDIFCYVVYDKAHIAQIKDCIEKLYVLSNHNRQISDVDWSKVDPNIVLTASSDTFINIWDIRTNAKPTIVLKSVGAYFILF
ncbi:hypothetical protein A3Q56_07877 [Intoshia linei]|uniref:Uncharacterized protein n=1 Tax=Intoshia linei TaxID=1819745 RepID=A0A177AT11_9BILA|nr:hypothetical protein A3Q56_07877 [Intoshia linei]